MAILANSRAITPKCLIGSVWLSNLVDILPTNTFTKFDDDQLKTIILIYYILKVIERTNTLDAAGRPGSHNTSRFFKRAYKKRRKVFMKPKARFETLKIKVL